MSEHATLGLGIVQAWLADLDDALGRLVVAGVSHPDPEIPVTLELLSERAVALGLPTAAEHLAKMSTTTSALRPGPPDLASRTVLARSVWDELMALLAWQGLLQSEIRTREAGLRAKGIEVDAAGVAEDVPRFSGRVWIDGLTLSSDRLVIVGHDADGEQVLAFDPLAGVPQDDAFSKPVISRLFQSELHLGTLSHSVLDFDRHPVASRGTVRLLQPAFRAVPSTLPWSGPAPDASAVQSVDAHVSAADGDVVVRLPVGVSVGVGRTLKFNLVKWMAARGSGGALTLRTLPRREERVVVAAVENGNVCFPHVDARAYRLEPDALADRAGDASLWLRAAISDFHGMTGEARQAVFTAVADCRGSDVTIQQLSWWAARHGAALPPWRPGPMGASSKEHYAAVWLRLWHQHPAELESLLSQRYEDVPEPSLYDVCTRALLLDAVRSQREEALDYLRAHLVHAVKRGRVAPVMPDSGALIAMADTLSYLSETPRSGPVGDALQASELGLRERLAWSLYRWRLHGEEGTLADDLALAAVSRWGATVIGGI